MRMSDWSSDVCSSDLPGERGAAGADRRLQLRQQQVQPRHPGAAPAGVELQAVPVRGRVRARLQPGLDRARRAGRVPHAQRQGLAAQNDSGNFAGPMRLREALVQSRNLVSVRLLDAIGVEYARRYISHFGIDEALLPPNLAMSLGTAALHPLTIARGYSVFANGGFRITPW